MRAGPRAGATLLALILVLLVPARAADFPVPSQANWDASKKSIRLANGLTIAYVEAGNTAGTPILLIHDYTGNSSSWSLFAPFLEDHRLLAIDLRGHGKSDAPACCYDTTDFANDASLFLDAMGISKADVVGHSLGSLAAQLLAAQHPEKIDHLVLISSTTATGAGPASRLLDQASMLTPPINANGPFLTQWYANPNPVDADFLSRERAEAAAIPIHVWRSELRDATSADLTSVAPHVKAPVLVMWGEKDEIFDLSHQEKLEKAYPQAQFEIFAGAGHTMFWEFPKDSAKIISDFLTDETVLPSFDDLQK